MLSAEAAPRVTQMGTERIASSGRLEAEEPASRGGVPNRPAAIAGVGYRNDTRGHRRCGAAAGAACGAGRVPGVLRGPECGGFGGGQDAELGRVGTTYGYQSRSVVAVHELGSFRSPPRVLLK